MNRLLICEAISAFIGHCRYEKNLDEKTIRAYEADLKQFQVLSCAVDMAQIEKTQIQIWLRSLSPFKHKTIKRKLATLKCFFSFLELDYEWFNNPLRRMKIKLKEPATLPRIMSIDEIRLILNVLDQKMVNSHGQQHFLCIRDAAIIELLLATGIRVGELCKLMYEDVNLLQGFVKIHGKGKRERVVAICQKETLDALLAWSVLRKSDNSYFFVNRLNLPITPQNVRQMVHGIVSGAELSNRITPHTFRHTFATLLLEEDVDIRYIQQILGHSSIKTTEIYTHVTAKKQREILLNKHPRRRV